MPKVNHSGPNLFFWCPGCDEAHRVIVDGSRGWIWNGDIEKPTISPSVLVRSGHYAPGRAPGPCWCEHDWNGGDPSFKCTQCHSFVREGRIEFLGDSTHALAGQTVDLPPWETEMRP